MHFTYNFVSNSKILLLLLLGSVFTLSYGQPGIMANYEKILEDVFYSDYQFAEMDIDSLTTNVGRNNERTYFVYYTSKGYRMRAEYDYRMEWKLTYVYILFKDLPENTQRYIQANYQDFTPISIRYQDAPKDSYYKVDVQKDSLHYQLRFKYEGDFIKELVR